MPDLDTLGFLLAIQFCFAMVVAVMLALGGVFLLVRLVTPTVRRIAAACRRRNQTEQRIQEIQAIGQQARREMQRLYENYVRQLVQLNRR